MKALHFTQPRPAMYSRNQRVVCKGSPDSARSIPVPPEFKGLEDFMVKRNGTQYLLLLGPDEEAVTMVKYDDQPDASWERITTNFTDALDKVVAKYIEDRLGPTISALVEYCTNSAVLPRGSTAEAVSRFSNPTRDPDFLVILWKPLRKTSRYYRIRFDRSDLAAQPVTQVTKYVRGRFGDLVPKSSNVVLLAYSETPPFLMEQGSKVDVAELVVPEISPLQDDDTVAVAQLQVAAKEALCWVLTEEDLEKGPEEVEEIQG